MPANILTAREAYSPDSFSSEVGIASCVNISMSSTVKAPGAAPAPAAAAAPGPGEPGDAGVLSEMDFVRRKKAPRPLPPDFCSAL